ncbi:hypothetical protein G8D25_19205 [Ralstonia solanacearum]|uniref:hypothetical protein n=1 Tax=Ralstonia solanacearum TaxID=305 RepID=UPI0012D41EED|nr:hypothetical protein [Ralstonia solanacearum]QJC26140.1 hypothetical protein G8D25_19205 [Ralstonia solanacearum]
MNKPAQGLQSHNSDLMERQRHACRERLLFHRRSMGSPTTLPVVPRNVANVGSDGGTGSTKK